MNNVIKYSRDNGCSTYTQQDRYSGQAFYWIKLCNENWWLEGKRWAKRTGGLPSCRDISEFRAVKVEGVECVIEEIGEMTFIRANRMCIQWPQSRHSSRLHQTLKIWPLLVTEKPTLSGGLLCRLAATTGALSQGWRRGEHLGPACRMCCLGGRRCQRSRKSGRLGSKPSPTPTPGSCQGGYCCSVITGLAVERECTKL